MKISGFTMVRNADKLYFPIKESIQSVLPIVDEFIVALGDCGGDDKTLQLIESINSEKVKIYHRTWSEESFVDGRIFVEETNFALSKCSGDWCIYLQADEVVHERDLDKLSEACLQELNNPAVEGFLFKYFHFWGDYNHYLPFHGWYKNEIRIIRNRIGVQSFKDAQSFRKQDNQKLRVKALSAHIYHYGWVRPPHLMQAKRKEQDSMHHGVEFAKRKYVEQSHDFNYGPMGKIPVFKGTHPHVMADFIRNISWQASLNYSKKGRLNRAKAKHEKLKYRVLSFLENKLNGGQEFVGYTNWKKI